MYLAEGGVKMAVPCCAASVISPDVAGLRRSSGTPQFAITQASPSLTTVIFTDAPCGDIAPVKYGTSQRNCWRRAPGAGCEYEGRTEKPSATMSPAAILIRCLDRLFCTRFRHGLLQIARSIGEDHFSFRLLSLGIEMPMALRHAALGGLFVLAAIS